MTWVAGLVALGLSLVIIPLFSLSYRKGNMTTRKIVILGFFLALAIAVAMFESMIPDFFLPGFKLGLANIVIVILLFGVGWKEALIVDVLRVFVVSLLRGNMLTMGGVMSYVGMALSFLGMLLLYLLWKKASVIFVSIIGALLHDVGQIIVAIFYQETISIIYYLPFMALLSIGTGALAGIVAIAVLKNGVLKRYLEQMERKKNGVDGSTPDGLNGNE